jgi:hypothetical protein
MQLTLSHAFACVCCCCCVQLDPALLLPLLFKLFRVNDKQLRELLFRHIIAGGAIGSSSTSTSTSSSRNAGSSSSSRCNSSSIQLMLGRQQLQELLCCSGTSLQVKTQQQQQQQHLTLIALDNTELLSKLLSYRSMRWDWQHQLGDSSSCYVWTALHVMLSSAQPPPPLPHAT